jgi:hypothetical protein
MTTMARVGAADPQLTLPRRGQPTASRARPGGGGRRRAARALLVLQSRWLPRSWGAVAAGGGEA